MEVAKFPLDASIISTLPCWYNNLIFSLISAVKKLTHLTSFVLLLFSHHSSNHSLSLQAKRNSSRGEFPCCWRWCCRAAETTHQSQRDNDWSSWLPYRTSVKLSFVGAAFLCIVLLFAPLNQTMLILSISWTCHLKCLSCIHILML